MKFKGLNIAGQFKFTAILSYSFTILMVILLVVGLVQLQGITNAESQKQAIIVQLMIQIVALAVLAVLGTIVGFTMRARIRRSVSSVSEVLSASADGDFTRRAKIYSQDEIGELSQSVNKLMDFLTSLVKQLNEGSSRLEQFAATSSQAATAVQTGNDQVLRSTQQLSTTGEALNSMAESLTDNGTAVAGDIAKLSGTATENERLRTEGMTAAKDLESAIYELKQAVDQIYSLMQDIATISGETNMLALNATIEAARSAEAGKGFKVVADQAKDLATQTAETTTDVLARVEVLEEQATQGTVQIAELLEQLEALSDGQQAVSEAVAGQEEALGRSHGGVTAVRDLAIEMSGQATDLSRLVDASHGESLRFQEHMGVLSSAVAALQKRVSRFRVD
ncbi:MAG: methyl-accepting chemotaxis protein [Mobiluncus porci]|uniref:Methyl-accepting chemotaxis protein n=1 Tax=Mobiluncus porci TaxID=2652278 RepID=A0A7K0JZU7_9ACTO|nr:MULTISPECIES: methyl-accepting chemotaxis protein [Mobiluncus]MCI6585309.1 methyl-accepting chemotaxis protein [Mobiluncus sp.]MDD7541482.1 methyl-accepting chemotaxis protein [Mobiluncus porci]MDY5748467.1 methyl-accepting chemotaxis protein [Mobiluncus porci]MST48776.1 methyl-accepting chemotaxis protein [Mobiluncus porci]